MRITLCGLVGTGKGSTGHMLETMDVPFVSAGDYYRDIAKRENISLDELERRSRDDQRYDDEVDRRTVRFGAERQEFIFDGRLAWFFIENTFKILLTCDFNTRISRVAIRDRVSLVRALELTVERERLQRERYDQLYALADFDDPKYFDLVIDTTSMAKESVPEKIREVWKVHSFKKGVLV